MYTAKSNKVQERSIATEPMRNGLMNRRRNRSGGSVTVYVASARINTTPRGRHCGAICWTHSRMNRDHSKAEKHHRIAYRMFPNTGMDYARSSSS